MSFNSHPLATSSLDPSSSQLPSASCNYSFNHSKGVRDYTERIRIEFPRGWNHDDDPIIQWYYLQPNFKFRAIEYRKERGGVQHEYILVLLQDSKGNQVNSYCRLERVADPAHRMEAIGVNGTTAFDFIQTIDPNDPKFSDQVRADAESELVARIAFPRVFGLADILGICYGIYSHPRARRYTLQQFNCYFYSWAVILCLARRAANWESALSDGINEIRGAVINHVENLRSSQTFTAWSLVFRVHDEPNTPSQHDITDRFLHEISSQYFLDSVSELLGPLLWCDPNPHSFRPALAKCLERVVNQSVDPLLDGLNIRNEATTPPGIPELARICFIIWSQPNAQFHGRTDRELAQAWKQYFIKCVKKARPANRLKMIKKWAKVHLQLLGPTGLMGLSNLLLTFWDNYDQSRALLCCGNTWKHIQAPLSVAKTIFDLPWTVSSFAGVCMHSLRWDAYMHLTNYVYVNEFNLEGARPPPETSAAYRCVCVMNKSIQIFADRHHVRDMDSLRETVMEAIRWFYQPGWIANGPTSPIGDGNMSTLWKLSLQTDLGGVIAQAILDTVVRPASGAGRLYEWSAERISERSGFISQSQYFSHSEIQNTIRERISRLSKREIAAAPIAQYVLRLPFTTPPQQTKEEMETAIEEIWRSCGPLMR